MRITIRRQIARSSFASVLFALTLAALVTWATPLTAGDRNADRVFGKPDVFTYGCNTGGRSAASLCFPTSVKVDSVGNLYVADRGNHRVLIYRTPLTTDLVADMVIGQPDFFSGTANNGGLSASSLNTATDITVDAAGNLYVADSNNNRVLEYGTPLTTDAVADRVFGQPDFTTNTCNTGGLSASSLCLAQYVAVGTDGALFVTDVANDRVLAYLTPLTTDAVADWVFGKPDFTTPTDHVTNSFGQVLCATPGWTSLCDNRGVAVDNAGNLFVADSGLDFIDPPSRVVVYADALSSDNVADQVFGQPDFTSYGCKGGPDGLCVPRGVAVDAAGNLYVADFQNHRVLEYDTPPLGPDSDGDGIVDSKDPCPFQNPGGLDADHDGCFDTLPGLRVIVSGLTIDQTAKNGLLAKLDEAQKALNHGGTRTAINKLMDFITQVNARRGTAISNSDADLLVAYANNVISTLT